MTVTKEMVQAFLDFIKEDTWAYCGEEEKQYYYIDGLVNVEAALEAALAAMPGPAVKVKHAALTMIAMLEKQLMGKE